MKVQRYHQYIALLYISCISAIVTFVYRFPDVYAYLTTPPGMVFLGQNTWLDPHDLNVYVSVIHYGQQGHFLLTNLWGALPNQSILIFPIELLLGYVFRFINPYLLFWLSSIVSGVLLTCGIFWLLRKSGLSYLLTAATTLGIALGGGFGFFLFPNISSADIINTLTFYEAFFKPHEAISLLCYLYALVMSYQLFFLDKKQDLRKLIALSLCLVVSLLIYPYLLLSYLAITLPFLYKHKIKIVKNQLAIIYIPTSIIVCFVAWQLSLNKAFSEPLIQHLPADPLATLFGYGLLLPIFCYQLFFMKKTRFISYLSWWIGVTLVLAFLPFGPSKLFLRGLFFPLVLIVVLQLRVLMGSIKIYPIRMIVWIVFFALLCATNISILFLRNYVAHTSQSNDIVYMPQEEFNVFMYLNNHTPRESSVLAGEIMSNLIPANTYNRGGIGSMGSNTPTYVRQLNAISAFYAGQPNSKDYLKQNRISYVLWGPAEQTITNQYFRGEVNDLSDIYKNLKLVYATETSKLYKVK